MSKYRNQDDEEDDDFRDEESLDDEFEDEDEFSDEDDFDISEDELKSTSKRGSGYDVDDVGEDDWDDSPSEDPWEEMDF